MKRFDAKTLGLLTTPALALFGFAALISMRKEGTPPSVVTNQIRWKSLPPEFAQSGIEGPKAFEHHVVVRYSVPPLTGFIPFVTQRRLTCTPVLTDAHGKKISGGNGATVDGLGRFESLGFYSDSDLRSAQGPIVMRVRCQWNDGTSAFDLRPQVWKYHKGAN